MDIDKTIIRISAMGSGEIFSEIGSDITELETALRFLVAVSLGGLVGLEREVRERAAGLRTHAMTSLASAIFTVITFEIFHDIRSLDESAATDPIRLIQAVTAGVSFLAAGTIIHGSGKVRGLTTGAGIWLAGAIGVASGAGYFFIALLGTFLALVIFVAMRWMERHVLETKGERN